MTGRPYAALAALGSLCAAAALASPALGGDEPFSMISVDEVEKLLGRPGVAILDANGPDLWERHHLPGAVHVEGRELAPLLPRDRSATLVFYCASPT